MSEENDKCVICNSEETERLTGEDLPFIGRRTAYDEIYGYSYLKCHACSTVQAYGFIKLEGTDDLRFIDHVVSWDLSQMSRRLEEMNEKLET